jgi:hypothetical protein
VRTRRGAPARSDALVLGEIGEAERCREKSCECSQIRGSASALVSASSASYAARM